MTARSIRRAAERQARKLARKAEKVGTDLSTATNSQFTESSRLGAAVCPDFFGSSDPQACPPILPAPISEAQLAANRANSQLSTGPTSEAGKAKSSLNAVKTGLTGRTV